MDNARLLCGLSIWDGHGSIDADAILIHGSQIAAVGTAAKLRRRGLQERNCQGLWATPGLIDAHVHMELNHEDRQPPKDSQAADYEAMCARARRMVQAGITTARDLGGGSWTELRLRNAIRHGEVPGPTLLCAGQPITTPTGHCHFWGGGAANADDALAVIARQCEHGVDLIKVMASGGVMTRNSKPADAQFEQDLLNTIVAAAAARSLSVAAHCHSTLSIERATLAGVRTIEHCSWVGADGWGKGYDPDIVEAMRARDVWVSPTINRGWQRHLDNADSTRRDQLREIFGDMRTRGVPIIASTDAGIPGVRHEDLPLALPVMQQLTGSSSEETLRAATSAAAIGIGYPATGEIRAGRIADLLLLSSDPTQDLTALANPVQVYARGQTILGSE